MQELPTYWCWHNHGHDECYLWVYGYFFNVQLLNIVMFDLGVWQDCDIQACATDGELIISVQGIWRAPSEFSICVRLCLFSVWGIGFILAGDILLLVVPFYSASCRYHSSGQHGGIRYVSLGVFCDRYIEVGGINDNSMI